MQQIQKGQHMKRISLYTLVPLLLCTVLHGSDMEKEKIFSWPQEKTEELIYGTGFEDPRAPEIKLGEGFRYVYGEGNNGNTALRVDRTGDIHRTQDTILALPKGKIRPGYQYKAVVSVKGRGLRHHTRPVPPGSHRFMELFYRDARTGASTFERERVIPFAAPPERDDFQEFSCRFPGIEGADAFVRLALWIDFHGTLWFDDLRIYREGVDANAFLIEPACATFFRDSGKFRIRVHLPQEYQNPLGVVELFKDGKCLQSKVIKAENSWMEGDFGKHLPSGEAALRITLADSARKLRIKTVEVPVNVRPQKNPPRGAVTFDRRGRMRIDGKPVLPLGVFYGSLAHQREDNLRLLADSPFNFIIDYSALSMAQPQDPEKITAIRKGLDRMEHYGIKCVFNLNAFYSPNSNYVKRGWAGETDPLSMTRKLAEGIKDHPALLGWYLTDELSEGQLAVPVAMRRVLNRLDPYHPTFTLSNLPSAMPNYAVSGDVFVYDPYPLDKAVRGRAGVERIISGFRERAHMAGCPVWAAPQAFNWGIQELVRRGKKVKLSDYVEPTEDDIRSMALLCALDGAAGFCFFNFPFPWEDKVKKRYAELGMADYPEKLWKKIKAAGWALKSLEPCLTGTAEAFPVRIENRGKANTRACLWWSENGRKYLVIVGCGGGKSDALITVPGAAVLKSRFGHTVHLGNGIYRFRSEDLNSDILMDAGE